MMGIRKVASIIAPHWHKVIAEEGFQLIVVALTQSLTPEHLQYMADNGLSLAEVLQSMGESRGGLDSGDDPRAQYLQSCTDDHLIALIADVAPAHAAVIRTNPEFAARMLADIRSAVGGNLDDESS